MNNCLEGLKRLSLVLDVMMYLNTPAHHRDLASLRLQDKSSLTLTTVGRTLCVKVLFGGFKNVCKSQYWMNTTLP